MTDSMSAARASSCSSEISPVSSPTTPVTEPPSTVGPGVAERPTARLDGRGEVGARLVQVCHDDGTRHADRGALAPEQRHGTVDVVGAGDDEDRCVGGPQPGAQVPDEVGVAGGVEQVEGDGAGREGGGGEAGRADALTGAGALTGPA